MLSAALGEALYPHPQWRRLTRLWESFYPARKIPAQQSARFSSLMRTMPRLVQILIEHRAAATAGRSLAETLATDDRRPVRLSTAFRTWRRSPSRMRAAPASLVFAVIGQARADGEITPEQEGRLLAGMLRHWALRSTLDYAASCAAQPRTTLPVYAVN
jgi:hypothetical protein